MKTRLRAAGVTLIAGLLTVVLAGAAGLPEPRPRNELYSVAEGDSLYRIVRAEYPELRQHWPQIMRDVVKENPDAFRSADPGSLRVDATLVLLDYGIDEDGSDEEQAATPATAVEPVAQTGTSAPATPAAVQTPPRKGHTLSVVGRVAELHGSTQAIDINNNQRTLRPDAEIFRGDALLTGPDSTLRITLLDEAEIILRQETRLVVETYTYQPSGTGSSAILSLLQGAFRSITGLLGHNEPNAVRINTPLATIGIRGTDLGVRICEPNECTLPERRAPVSAGVYAGVLDGAVAVETAAGSLPLARGEFGKAISPTQIPLPAPEAAALVFTPNELAGLTVEEPPLGFWKWLKYAVFGRPD